ncbi:MAG: HAMP domain-containing sensor histidine kinase [Candidatus Paceibacterota bacterium]
MKEVSQREKIEKLAVDLERSNTELEVANEKLKELDKQKTEFVSIASHQLRSPLTAIKGYSSMLLEGSFGKITGKSREAVQVVFESSQKLVGVIEDFLNITRIELGKMKYEMTTIDMGHMVESVVNELKPNVMRRGLTMTFTGAEGPYNIFADAGKLNQVFLNVIDNAIKYTEKGSIAVAVARRQEGGKNLIRFTSTDTGVGMDQATIPKLFEKFVRATGAGAINITGTGLGLYVAKQIVEAHGGKIWAESAGKGKGSQFIVEMEEKKG